MILIGISFTAFGIAIASRMDDMHGFQLIMNFVIFPMFFASSALYPLWRMKESSLALYHICRINPFTHAVELIRFALYGQLSMLSLAVTAGCAVVFFAATVVMYDPAKGLWRGKHAAA